MECQAEGAGAGGPRLGARGGRRRRHEEAGQRDRARPSWTQCFFVFVFFLPFLGLLPRRVEVPRLGVQSELQPAAYTKPQQCGI